jgi:GTPase SAR1 family protein
MIKINLFGAPSSGKSAMAALVFGNLKLRGLNAELVTEYAKDLVWKKIDVKAGGESLQLEIFVNQLKKEEDMRGRVDYLVTDSPLLLNAYYGKNELTKKIALTKKNDVEFNFWLTRTNFKFESEGRVHTQEESSQIGKEMMDYIKDSGVHLDVVSCPIKERADYIVDFVLKHKT